MNKYLQILIASGIVLLGSWSLASATSTFITQQGGTGTSTPSGILYGDNGATSHLNTVSIGSGLTFSGGTLSSSASSASSTLLSDSNTFSGVFNQFNNTIKVSSLSGVVGANGGTLYAVASSSLFGFTPTPFPFTPNSGANVYNSTTTILAFPGFISSASSTVSGGSLKLTPLATAAGTFLAVDATGQIIATTTLSITNTTGYKDPVNYATVSALPANTYLAGVLTEVGTGALSVDGASPVIGNRILVKNEGTQTNNGVYDVTATGSGIAAYVLTRSSDYNTSAKIYPGVATYVIAGTTNGDTSWALTSPAPITLDTTNLTYVESANGNIQIPVTVSQGGTGVQTFTSSQLLYGNGTNTLSSVATTTEACGTGIACTTHVVLGTGGTITLATMSAGVLATAVSGVAPASISTSTFLGVGTAGYVWSMVDGGGKWVATSSNSGGVTSVSNSDSTITISPTTGDVIASLNLAHINAWTVKQSFAYASTTQLTIGTANAGTKFTLYGGDTPGAHLLTLDTSLIGGSDKTITFPNTTGTLLVANQSITLSGAVTGTGSTAITTSFGSQSAGVLATAVAGVPTFTATSTLYGAGTGGQLLWNTNGGIGWLSTTTLSILFPVNQSSPTVSGSCEIDTTNGQLQCGSAGTTSVFDPRIRYSFGMMGTTSANTITGSTTAQAIPFNQVVNFTSVFCSVQPAGATVDVRWSYGGADTQMVYIVGASSTPGVYTISGSPVAFASSTVTIGKPSGSPTSIGCTAVGTAAGT